MTRETWELMGSVGAMIVTIGIIFMWIPIAYEVLTFDWSGLFLSIVEWTNGNPMEALSAVGILLGILGAALAIGADMMTDDLSG